VKPTDPLDAIDDVTRRQWLLRLGEMIVLAGISGVVPETSISFLEAQQDHPELPPGLYTPSTDDLVHALSAHNGLAPPAGSETDYAQPARSPFQPQFFSPDEFRIVTRLAEIILGKVEPEALAHTTRWIDLCFQSSDGVRRAAQQLDPLHRALAVAYFGEAAVRELETADPAKAAHGGIAALQELSRETYKKDFADLDSSQQAELVSSISAKDSNGALRKCYDLIRRETIRGYYTTAEGLKELDYKGNAYYAECPGCDTSRGESSHPQNR
jgi:Gluconate 2-dehydrogenase subunit 3